MAKSTQQNSGKGMTSFSVFVCSVFVIFCWKLVLNCIPKPIRIPINAATGVVIHAIEYCFCRGLAKYCNFLFVSACRYLPKDAS